MEKEAFVLFLLFFFSLFIPHSSALGIAPGEISMDFVPNLELEFDGQVFETAGGTVELDVYVEGDLKDHITLLTPDYVLLGPNQAHSYKFKLKMPEEFETPGEHLSIVWAREHVDPVAGGAVARIKVGTIVKVRVPYPGKYLFITLDIENQNVNDTVLFDISASNLGKENITNAKGEIKIIDIENRTIVLLQTEGKFIEHQKTENLRATWFSDVDPGIYRAEVTVNYDGEIAKLEREFNLGAPLIDITEVHVEPVINGTIAKILTEIKSLWNQKIDDTYVEIFIRDKDGTTLSSEKSQSLDVLPFDVINVTNYWDTTNGFPLGDYDGFAVLNYLEKNDTFEFDLELISEPGFSIGYEFLIIIAVVIILVIILFFLVFRKKRNKYKQKKIM